MKKILLIGILVFLAGCGQSTINTIGAGYGLAKVTYKLNATARDNNIILYDQGKKIYDVDNEVVTALDAAWDLRSTNDDAAKTIAQKAVKDIETVLATLNKLGVK